MNIYTQNDNTVGIVEMIVLFFKRMLIFDNLYAYDYNSDANLFDGTVMASHPRLRETLDDFDVYTYKLFRSFIDRFSGFFPISSFTQKCNKYIWETELELIRAVETSELSLDSRVSIPIMSRSVGFVLSKVYNLFFNCYYSSSLEVFTNNFYYKVFKDPLKFFRALLVNDKRIYDT